MVERNAREVSMHAAGKRGTRKILLAIAVAAVPVSARAADTWSVSIGVREISTNPAIGSDGGDIVEYFVEARVAEERFHFRDVTVIGSPVGNEGAAHGTVLGIRNLAPNDGLPTRPAG